MVYRLPESHIFPDPRLADEDGLIAVGGDLDPDRILLAYTSGIFPWFSKGRPILWWSPNPRLILRPEKFKVSASLKRTIHNPIFKVTINSCFPEVIKQCARVKRPDQPGTWITAGMKKAYIELHKMGFAHSFETWHADKLVGGLYGIAIGKVFCGESMFHLETDASKLALAALVAHVKERGFHMIDCQMTTSHLLSLGAEEICREKYLEMLKLALE